MSTAVSSGMYPRFAPSHTQSSAAASGQSSDIAALIMGEGGDALDFDLLAEYLLEDTDAALDSSQFPTFEFNVESGTASGVVSPEMSEDGIPPAASLHKEGSIAQVESLIAAHAAAQAQGTAAMRPQMQAIAPMPAQPVLTGGSAFPPLAPNLMMPKGTAPLAPASNKRRRVDEASSYMQAPPAGGRGREKSQAQIDRRRERNRILARRTRLRKKFFFESLQKEVMDLQRENSTLKDIARAKLDSSVSTPLLDSCNAVEQLPDSIAEACGENSDMAKQDFSLVKSIQSSQRSFIITDPSLQDNPIVYASEGFLSMTGYSREQVLGRNCRFLQGTETSPAKVEEVRKAVANGEDCTVTMINYTADGTAFWNKLFIAALRDAQNNIVNFIGVTVKVARPDSDDPEAGKRLPGEQADDDGDNDEDD